VYNEKIAKFIVEKRIFILVTLIIMTVFFAYKIGSVKISTNLGDLLPQKHPYVQLHNKFREVFGGANIIFINLSVKKGDIFTPKTLEKISKISEEVIYLPGADRYKVMSIAQSKVKDFRATAWGMEVKPIMPNIPKTDKEMDYLKESVYSNDMVYGTLVSLDSKSALISLQFYENIPLDYYDIFIKTRELCNSMKDENTDIAISGETMIRGYIYSYLGQTKMIFAVTCLAVVILLFVYTKSLQMVILPLLSAILSGVWGLGLIGLLGYNLDPLALVVPLLITARTVSHSVQFNERFIEEYQIGKDVKTSAHKTIKALFMPGLAGILTDAAGIAVLAVIPIPMLQKLGIISSFWALTTIFTVLFMTPLILIFFPGFAKIKERKDEEGIFYKILRKTALINTGRFGSALVITLALIVALIAFVYARELKVGDAKPGTPILRSDSQYNYDAMITNNSFPGLNPMLVVLEGEKKDALYDYEMLHQIEAFQRHIGRLPSVGGTLSIVNLLKKVNVNLHEGHPKWNAVPETRRSNGMLFYMLLTSTEVGDLDAYCTFDNRVGSIMACFKDHKGDTLREAMESSRSFIEANPVKGGKFRMAAGVVGTLAAANDEVFKSQIMLLFMTFGITILLCSITYRSLVAGLLLAVPLAVSNYMIFAYMGLKDIGLNINTLPVATIAIGLGVDYGIYFLSRMQEEYRDSEDWQSSFFITLVTTGKAITFTALTVALGVVFWGFSNIKFQADMGMLLTIVTFLHLAGTLILLPALVLIIKPKFITSKKKEKAVAKTKDIKLEAIGDFIKETAK